ncbi:MAG TPA: hypothetical protein EYN71_07290 [Flavobacteriales bacterium]|nr:hypothetical protein [Flavobacteriales bacterium]HIO67965.1 hypothetical protein [Flavobacteriales bacterium]
MKQDPIINNPELKRNAWLEISIGRLVVMPIILSAVFLLAYVMSDSNSSTELAENLQGWSLTMFGLIVLVWGSKQASEAVLGEINDRTWDLQRLTLINPWVMSIGKLFGSTIYSWYGGGLCLLVYIWSSLLLPQLDTSLKGGLAVGMACIFVHATVISMSLTGARKNRSAGKVKSTFYFMIALLIGGYLFSVLVGIFEYKPDRMHWYNIEVVAKDFTVLSVFCFMCWAILGLYRNMRTELQYRNGPWVWYGFLTFIIAYSLGFVNQDTTNSVSLITPLRYYLALGITVALTYYMVFSESKYIVDFRQLLDYFKTSRYKLLLHSAPIWLLTMFFLIPLSFTGVILYVSDPYFSIEGEMAITYPLTVLCFVVRDICFLIYINLAEKSKRADLATFVYLLLLYALIPSILSLMDANVVTLVFLPMPIADVTHGSLMGIVPVVIQVALIGYLLSKRYKKRNQGIEQSTARETTENLPPPLT